MKLRVVHPFDPWGNPLCTCPPKYSFSPYTGCSHACIYCYISSYIRNPFISRPKRRVCKDLAHDLSILERGSLISMANSSDPYPPMEEKLKLTRECLKKMKMYDVRLIVLTKSSIVARDVDILRDMMSTVSVTITTIDSEISRRIEPNAPEPEERIKALRTLINNGLACSVRIDPIIPGVNDDFTMLEELISKLSDIGVKQIVSSTYKARKDSLERLIRAFPELKDSLSRLYLELGSRVGRTYYLPRSLRLKYLVRLKELAEKYGLKFSTCREGLISLNSARTCDASHLAGIKGGVR